jgi:hypothetical protein
MFFSSHILILQKVSGTKSIATPMSWSAIEGKTLCTSICLVS